MRELFSFFSKLKKWLEHFVIRVTIRKYCIRLFLNWKIKNKFMSKAKVYNVKTINVAGAGKEIFVI